MIKDCYDEKFWGNNLVFGENVTERLVLFKNLT